MFRSSRVQPLSRNPIDEADVIPFARQLSAYCHALFIPTNLLPVPHIDPYYTAYADHLRPLASFSTVPDNLCQADVTFSSDNYSHREQTEPMPQQYSDLRV